MVTNEIGTTEEFREMSFEDRKCRLPTETETLKLFKSYTKSACKFECAIERAVNTCLCKPWTIPRFKGEETPFCDMYGNDCFYWVMIKTETYENCFCDDDCESTNFNLFQSSSTNEISDGYTKV